MARARTEDAFNVVLASLEDEDRRIALKAAEIVLDRGWGKPAQTVTGDIDGEPIKITIQWQNSSS